MRSKEVEEAIKTIQEQKENVEHGINAMECTPEDYDEDVYNDYIELKKKADTVLSYISELEKLPNKIRDKIKELEDEFETNNSSDVYGSDYYIASEKYAFCEEKLKELLEKGE